MACDTKILMHDLSSSSLREIPRSVLDSKAPTCLAVLYNVGSRLLAGIWHRLYCHRPLMLGVVQSHVLVTTLFMQDTKKLSSAI